MPDINAVLPDRLLRRSPIYRYHRDRNAQFVEYSGGAMVNCYDRDRHVELAQAESLAIIDLTVLPRIGFKGIDSPDWLSRCKVALPDQANTAAADANVGTILRLSQHEFLLLDDLLEHNQQVNSLADRWSMDIR
ncbi:MAG: hypothetical protein HKN85_02205, partial [Gammaproteobacteria bacterium]|nr:hypothetical protein [Gammaproteobacteria bacterium]